MKSFICSLSHEGILDNPMTALAFAITGVWWKI